MCQCVRFFCFVAKMIDTRSQTLCDNFFIVIPINIMSPKNSGIRFVCLNFLIFVLYFFFGFLTHKHNAVIIIINTWYKATCTSILLNSWFYFDLFPAYLCLRSFYVYYHCVCVCGVWCVAFSFNFAVHSFIFTSFEHRRESILHGPVDSMVLCSNLIIKTTNKLK